MKLKILKKKNVVVFCSLLAVILLIPSAGNSADQRVLQKTMPAQLNTETIKKLPRQTPAVRKKVPLKVKPLEVEPLRTIPQTRDLQTQPAKPLPRILPEFPPVQDSEDGLGERKPIRGTVSFPGEEDPQGRLSPDGSTRQRPPCFIATAAYGSPMAEQIVVLGNFRDEFLLTHSLGRWFVGVYYKNSPQVAAFISRHESLRLATRAMLWPFVYAIMFPVYAAVFLVISVFTLISFAIVRRQTGEAHQAGG